MSKNEITVNLEIEYFLEKSIVQEIERNFSYIGYVTVCEFYFGHWHPCQYIENIYKTHNIKDCVDIKHSINIALASKLQDKSKSFKHPKALYRSVIIPILLNYNVIRYEHLPPIAK